MRKAGRQAALIVQAHEEWCNAPHGEKQVVLERYSAPLRVSAKRVRELFKAAGLVERREPKPRDHTRKYPDWKAMTRAVARRKFTPPSEEGALPTDRAVAIALADGAVPEHAASIPRRTFDRWFTELGFNAAEPRGRRLRATEPNECWYMDASRSKHWRVRGPLSRGDFHLEFQSRREGPYANKPERERRLRLWVYSIVDDYSSLQIARYVVAPGENSVDALRVLDWAMSRKRDDLVLRGRPRNLALDNGPIKSALKANDAFMRCGIGLLPRAPYSSRAGGRVERPFRTLWQRFEMSFWPRARAISNDGSGRLSLSLSELNTALSNYLREQASATHPTYAGMTRTQAWLKIAHTGLVEIAPGAIYNGFAQIAKTIDQAGQFRHGGRRWEVIGIQNTKGYVFEDLEGNMTFRDLAGYGYRVVPAQEAALGTWCGQPRPQRDKLVDELRGEVTSIYTLARMNSVAALTPEAIDEAEPELPFARPGDFPTVDEALSYFIDIIGVDHWRQFDPDSAAAIRNLLSQDLSERAIVVLADEFRLRVAAKL